MRLDAILLATVEGWERERELAEWQPVGNEIIFVSLVFTYDLSVMLSPTQLRAIPRKSSQLRSHSRRYLSPPW